MGVSGTYELEKNENFEQFLVAIGVKEDKATKMSGAKPTVTITAGGGKLEIVSKGAETHTNNLVVGSPSKFTLASGFELEVTISMTGNVAKGTLKRGERTGDVTIEFSDTGFVETFVVAGNTCKRTYKRV